MKRILTILCLLLPMLAIAGNSKLALQADSAYTDGDYMRALQLYDRAIHTDGVSATLYYNLGNTYYRIGKLGRAVICYNRALNLDPSMSDARQNLEFVKSKILDKPEDDSSFLGNMHDRIVSLMSANAWAWTSFGLFVALLGCVAMYLFSNNIPTRKTGFFGGIVVIMLLVYTLVISYDTSIAYNQRNRGVVVIPTTNLSTTPGNTGKDAKIIPIHEGTVVEVMDSTLMPGASGGQLWYEVKINNATRAWVNAADIELI